MAHFGPGPFQINLRMTVNSKMASNGPQNFHNVYYHKQLCDDQRRNGGVNQAKLWMKLWMDATKGNWLVTLRVCCPPTPTATKQDAYSTADKLGNLIKEIMDSNDLVLDILIIKYPGAPRSMFMTTAYVRIQAEHMRWALSLMEKINLCRVGHHFFTCTLETSPAPWSNHVQHMRR